MEGGGAHRGVHLPVQAQPGRPPGHAQIEVGEGEIVPVGVQGAPQGQQQRVGVDGDDPGLGEAVEQPGRQGARSAAQVQDERVGPAPAATASMRAVNRSSRSGRKPSCWRSQRVIQRSATSRVSAAMELLRN
ncbi:hypothetical protein GCM10029978_028380 [Actinoallomurus acanthiterrae]